MIGRSFLTASILFLVYQCCLWVLKPVGNHTLRGLHDMIFADGNIIRAERYLHEKHDQPIVLVGTSLTQMLEQYLEVPDVACLGMPGMSAFDGLAVIEHSKAQPKLVLVEINLLQRGPSKELQEEFLQPELYRFRHWFSAARQEYQPGNLIIPRLEAASRGERIKPPESHPAKPLPPGHQHQPGEDRGRLDWLDDDVNSAIEALPRLQEQLSKLGLPYGFYQLPEYPDVTQSAAMGRLRQAIDERFHQKVFMVPDDRYCTGDGQHLIFDDASACAFYLLDHARKRVQAEKPAQRSSESSSSSER